MGVIVTITPSFSLCIIRCNNHLIESLHFCPMSVYCSLLSFDVYFTFDDLSCTKRRMCIFALFYRKPSNHEYFHDMEICRRVHSQFGSKTLFVRVYRSKRYFLGSLLKQFVCDRFAHKLKSPSDIAIRKCAF